MPKIDLVFKIFCVDRAFPGRDFSTWFETLRSEKAIEMYNCFEMLPGERKRIVVKEGRKARTIAAYTQE